ncbi:sensor histidine kinase [Umezawaea endophytica]|uniref:histidine kinase n=1 Tax=Umezawaea endophytica TaxID=1654476 RepID=A0A9X2VXN9_9PSEU|nr:sensor histidine kinase [Umezawaea endophytica]MCS7484610.1 sensor histidine kinase [Umezawaea endophytica]
MADFRHLRPGELVALDCLAACALAGLYLSLSGQPWAAAALALPVGVRRLWPVPVFVVVAAVSVAVSVTGLVREPFVAAAFALYWVAAVRPGTWRVPTAKIGAASVVVLLGSLSAGSPAGGGVYAFLGIALLGMAWTVGRAVHERRAYATRSALQRTAHAVAEERLRIARELHDVVAHSIGVIAVKAGVANHVLAVRPQEAGEALLVIETASRSALAEMRHLLGALRSGTVEESDLRPAPGLAGLGDLVDRVRAAGVEVDARIGAVGGLPEGLDRSAYRIAQEALTNVVKHAPSAHCVLVVAVEGGHLRIDVTDDGRFVEPSSNGHGLIGMRERVALYGGTFDAGPQPEGGFAVRVRIPCGEP